MCACALSLLSVFTACALQCVSLYLLLSPSLAFSPCLSASGTSSSSRRAAAAAAAQMHWNQEELLQWSLAAKQKEEDREQLER